MDESALREHPVSTSYPLTPMQSGMLLDGLRGAQDGVYVQQLIATLHEPLNVSLFRDAWQRLVEHHAVLRTSFHIEEGDQLFQRVHPRMNWEMDVSDCRAVGTVAGEQQIAAYLRNEQRRGFGLENPPLWRLRLFSLSECDHRLVWTSHHALFDGRSRVILLRDLFALYDALLHGNPLSLESPQPFEDHVRQLTNRDFRSSKHYWQQVLGGFCSTTRLAQSIPGSVSDDEDQYRTLEIQLTEGVTQSLARVAQEFDVTLNTILHGAWASMLSLYSGTNDVVFGATRACRRTSVNGADSMVGLFINTLPVRARLRGSASLKEWLQELRAQWVAMRDHEQTPLTLVRQWSDVPADESLFESIVVFEKFSLQDSLRMGAGNWGNRSFRVLGNTNYPLIVAVYGGSRLRIELTYDRRRIADDMILDIQNRLQTWLEEIASNPGRTLAEVPIISPREKQQLVSDGNATATVIPRHGSVAHLFESQAASTPEAVALAFSNGQWKYRELNDRANRLARRLRAMGVGLETPVALCAERSPEMVAGILGILKAGGAYVPVDPTYPPDRIAFMLSDTKAPVLLTQRSLLSALPIDGIDVVCLDDRETFFDDSSQVNDNEEVDLPCPATFDSIAYIMFTSGSTGIPKGVAVPHRGIIRLVFGVDYVTLDPSRNILHLASPAFDASTFELWAALLHGGRCVLFPGRFPDLDVLKRILCENDVDTLFLTTALFHTIVDESVTLLSGVQQLLVGGEVLSVNHVRRALSCLPGVSIVNCYGPTETTTFATSYRIPRNVADDADSLPIGRPIGNTSIHVLDTLGRLVPAGVAGELYIGGPGVARGYWNQPELTAEKFVANPFSDDRESRLYRTGDLCRWRADGNLEFLGRMDGQVKLRGFRIELGEIESALNEYPDVAQCVVTLREDHPGDKRLVAYYVAASDSELTFSELPSYLQQRLPDYMLPSAFVMLDKLPLTSSGKINRRALPAPDDSRPELDSCYIAPRNLIEEQLASIWADVLGIVEIGIHDNFFAIGGHSLLATRVFARISSTFQVELPLRKLFEAPTIAELATEISTLRSGGLVANSTAVMRVDRDQMDRLPLSFAQQRLWFLEQMEGELTAYNMPFGWRLRGSLDVEALRRALEEIVRRHEPLHTTFAILDDAPAQVIQPSGRFELLVEDLSSFASELKAAEIERCCRLEAEKPFNLSADRMLRASLLHLAHDEHLLLLTMHHIASDGWSLRVLWRELAGLYDAYSCGAESNLRELPVQYADYAIWQRSELEGQRLEYLLQYWREHLSGVNVLELPTDRPRPALLTYRGAQHSFELPEVLVSQLKRLSQTAGVTLHMTLLAAFQTLLSRYSGQDDIAVGVPVAGRSHAELEDLIGFFVNTLVLRTDLSADPTFRELLERVRQVSLAAYDHQDLPFEKLVEELRPERQLNRSPLFQVLFQLLNFSDTGLALRDLDVSRLPSSSQRVRFDLEMHLWQQPETICGSVVYSTDLFDVSTIERMLGHFITLLEGIVAAPDQRISALPLLTEPERHQLLVEWNDTAVDYPRDKCVHELFEEQVERTPDAVAVVFEDQQLTYRELNERANQLAHHLIAVGVAPETLVGLCLERSLDLVVGILGILKAGGAYVPLDVNYPPQRLEFMLRDSAVTHLVTLRQLLDRLPVTDCAVICVDTQAQKLQYIPHSNPSVDVGSDNLAYAMYTSGSTGKPKCVLMPHAALVNLINWHKCDPHWMQPVSTLQFASYSFDVSFQEMLTTWCCGGCLVLISEAARRDPRLLWKVIVESGIERLFMPFVALQQLATVVNGADARLRDIVSAGEALQLTTEIRQLVHNLKNCRLHNHYGPTESHVVTSLLLSEETMSWPREAPIGRPIANTQVYVLDAQLQPAPIGVPGELYIGGAGLARGYHNQPELTAEKFVQNPFSHHANSRLYRTGDLCRWRAEGHLEFLGRIDDQVKLRGFRIELGEIEAALNEYQSVAQGVVTLREDRPGDKRLVAYCVPAKEGPLNHSELRSHLHAKLPDYMVPAAFVVLDKLPLTSSGKVNRRALPAPDDSRPELDTGYVAPRNLVEEQLASNWADVLGIVEIGIYDNFFALGGHSLLATRLIARINTALQVELSLRKLFEAPTIAELALVITTHCPLPELTTERFLSDVRPSTGCGTVICVGRGVIKAANSLSRNIGIIYLGSGTMDPVRFHHFGIEGVVDRYLAELLPARIQGPIVVVGYSYGGLVACALTARLRQLQQERVVAILLEPAVPVAPRNPARDSVVRIAVYVRKLLERRPMNFYNSLRFLPKKRLQKRRSAGDAKPNENPLAVILPQIYRNIAAFRPSQRLCGDVYLVAGTAWLNGVLERFQMMLAEFPCVLDLGEVTHEEASSKQECIASLTSLIGEILDDRERQGVFTPDITSGKHDIGRIRDDLPTAPIHGATRSLLSRPIRRQQS